MHDASKYDAFVLAFVRVSESASRHTSGEETAAYQTRETRQTPISSKLLRKVRTCCSSTVASASTRMVIFEWCCRCVCCCCRFGLAAAMQRATTTVTMLCRVGSDHRRDGGTDWCDGVRQLETACGGSLHEESERASHPQLEERAAIRQTSRFLQRPLAAQQIVLQSGRSLTPLLDGEQEAQGTTQAHERG